MKIQTIETYEFDEQRAIIHAPKLLEALKDLVSRFPEGPYEGSFLANARRVIASVEGGKS